MKPIIDQDEQEGIQWEIEDEDYEEVYQITKHKTIKKNVFSSQIRRREDICNEKDIIRDKE